MSQFPKYVIVTAARDEARFIELTLESVVAQTVLPLKWVIVSDGSTDGTDEIVSRYAEQHPWIESVRMPERQERHFAGKVNAFNEGHRRVKDLDFEVVVNLDADVSFDPDYFSLLLPKFFADPELGIAGTPFCEGSFQYDYRFTNIEHVSGPCQLFRRACFDDVGGYIAREIGGVDLVAVLAARMKGWRTRTFPEKSYSHHRPMGTAGQSAWVASWKGGKKDYVLGSHPMWQLFRCAYQTTRRPVLVGGGLRFIGFFGAMAVGTKKQVPLDVIKFRRKEEMHRLKEFLAGLFYLLWPVGVPLPGRQVWHVLRSVQLLSRHGLATALYLLTLISLSLVHHLDHHHKPLEQRAAVHKVAETAKHFR
jgi:glycosyltransferase involved in cell wall biosynthesis